MDSLDHSPDEVERFQRTLAAVPTDASTCLEIGFFDLRLTSLLTEKIDLVSIDLPREVAHFDTHKLAFADIQSLPFRDGSFDIVVCTEVLEHLPENVLSRGVRELQRVSRKYVLVTVPYKQLVWNDMFKCANCKSISNSMGHVRYLDEQKLQMLFSNVSPEKIDFIGTVEGYAPDWLYMLANKFGNAWCDCISGNCPNCGQTKQAVKPNLLGFFLQRIIWRLVRFAQPRPAWLLMLLKSPAQE